jgi:hypothetical protein
LLDKHLLETGIEVDPEADTSYFDDFGTDEQLPTVQIPEDKILSFFRNLLSNSRYDDRHLRFCLNHLRRSKSPAACDLVLSKLKSMPEATHTFVPYLSSLLPSNIEERHVEIIIAFLESDYNIYDWQIMWLLIFMAKLENISQDHLQRLYRNERLRKHDINRAYLSYILCSKGGLSLQRHFMSLYGQERSEEVKIAILCGLFNLEKKERNRFYGLAGGDRVVNQLIIVLKNKNVDFLQLKGSKYS